MVRCSGSRDGARCHRFCKFIYLKGAAREANPSWKCDSCQKGNAPFVPKNSERKGQQKQTKKK